MRRVSELREDDFTGIYRKHLARKQAWWFQALLRLGMATDQTRLADGFSPRAMTDLRDHSPTFLWGYLIGIYSIVEKGSRLGRDIMSLFHEFIPPEEVNDIFVAPRGVVIERCPRVVAREIGEALDQRFRAMR